MKKIYALIALILVIAALATPASAQVNFNGNFGFGVNLISTDRADNKATITIAAKLVSNGTAISEAMPDNTEPFAIPANMPGELVITLGVVAEDLQVNRDGTPRTSFTYSIGGQYQKVQATSAAEWTIKIPTDQLQPGTLRIFLRGTVAAGRNHTTIGGELVRWVPVLGRALTISGDAKTRPGSASAFPVIGYTGATNPEAILDWQVQIRRYIREKGVVPLFTPRDLFPQAPSVPNDITIPSMGGGNVPPAQQPAAQVLYSISRVPASILKFVVSASEAVEVVLDYRADPSVSVSQTDLDRGWVRKWSLRRGQSTPVIRVDGPHIEIRIGGTTISKEELTKILQETN
jgi:hypothetical protein